MARLARGKGHHALGSPQRSLKCVRLCGLLCVAPGELGRRAYEPLASVRANTGKKWECSRGLVMCERSLMAFFLGFPKEGIQ